MKGISVVGHAQVLQSHYTVRIIMTSAGYYGAHAVNFAVVVVDRCFLQKA